MKTFSIIVTFISFGAICFKVGMLTESEVHADNWQYNLDIVNQDSVKIQATDSHTVYKTDINSIDLILSIDNM